MTVRYTKYMVSMYAHKNVLFPNKLVLNYDKALLVKIRKTCSEMHEKSKIIVTYLSKS